MGNMLSQGICAQDELKGSLSRLGRLKNNKKPLNKNVEQQTILGNMKRDSPGLAFAYLRR